MILNPSTIAEINHQGAIRIKCHDATILDFFTGSLSRGCFGTNEGHALVAITVVERFKQEFMYGLSAGTINGGRCTEVFCF